MKEYKLEQFLADKDSDVGSGLLANRGHGFCFVLKAPHRWEKEGDGLTRLPFGGIGGKLERGESPAASLHRESLEEVGSDVKITEHGDGSILIDSGSVTRISLSTELPDELLPAIIFRSPRAEFGRKPYTNVLIYTGKFTSDSINPIDDPAIIEMTAELLLQLSAKSTTVEEFQRLGGRVTSRIDLPKDGILKPIGTAIATTLCLREGIIDTQILK